MQINLDISETYDLPVLPDDDLIRRANDFSLKSRSEATNRGYESDWKDWSFWCSAHGYAALPASPKQVGLYLTDRATTLKTATLRRRLVTISQAHRIAGYALDSRDTALRDVFSGIRRAIGTKQTPKNALVTSDLRSVLKALPDTIAGARDRAILLIGFAGAFRRSELVSLDFEHLMISIDGVRISLGKSKTDQEGAGENVGIPRGKKNCPVDALRHWLRVSQIKEGPLFRPVNRHGAICGRRLSDKAISDIVKRAVERVGLDPKQYAGHSLRSGFCTSAAAGNAELPDIARQARQKSIATTMRYVQQGKIFGNKASKAVGL